MTEENPKICEKEELEELFNKSFLPTIQEFARRAVKMQKYEDLQFFNVQLIFHFAELEKPITYEDIEQKLSFHLFPVTQKDIEDAEKKAREKNEESSS